ncbi:hypothetical protein N7535_008121 [Penicillium sp. DV-2018c]|nr:hypothetical protein N7535_008121 [Penicillium sp. DV-2018c]
MPKKPTPAAKQRVRTGCLICRKRRRKCDEQKPSCANCQAKGFTCKYASDLQFAPPLSGAVSGGKQGYSSITFVNESPVATGSKTREQQKPANDSQSNADLSVDGLENPVDDEDNSGDTSRAFEFQSIQSSAEPMADFSEPLVLSGGSRDAPDTRYMNSAPYFGYKSVAKERTAEKPELLANGSHETDLLRHFRYHVGPWIDTGDPELPFGLQVLLLSRTNKALQAAILALSAGQRLLVASPNTQDLESRHRFRKEAEEKLEREYDLARYAGQTLLMLQDVLPVGPLQWRNVLMPGIKHINDFASRAGEEEVAEGLLWLYFRLGRHPVIPTQSK